MNTRQRKRELVKGVLAIGVDIGKLKHFAALRGPGGIVVKVIEFTNNKNGFQRLVQEVNHWCMRLNLPTAVLGIEPTGHYWLSLAYWWEDNQGQVVLVNPMHTNRAKELEDNSPLKSDPKDAEVISGLVADGKYLECHLPRGVFATLRNLIMQRTRCQKHEASLLNQLHQSVERIFPEIESAFSSLMTKSCRELLLRYADPAVLSQVSVEDLQGMLKKWSRGQLGRDRADKIIDLARTSIGVPEGKQAIIIEVRRLLGQITTAENDRSMLEEEIEKCLRDVPGAAVLLTIPDFGPLTVAAILAHTGDLANYQHPDQAIKLAGLNLYEISSGQHRGKVRITKRGRQHLRKILYMAALRASRKCGSLHHYYGTLVGRGLSPTAALVAVMRKLLRISWSLVKTSQTFDANKLMRMPPQAA
jgi:transposase